MRPSTVKSGLKMLIFAVSLLIIASFYHEEFSTLLPMSVQSAAQFLYLSFFWSAVLGGCGIVVVIFGLLGTSKNLSKVRIAPTLMLFIAVVGLFFMLLYRSVNAPETAPKLRPGETVII